MSTIGIIPARGGSKRIPGKNLIEFEGKPLIVWTIEAALNSGIFSRLLVSTDDSKIARVSEEVGASVPFLRDECADDLSEVSSATIIAVNQAKKYWNEDYENIVQLLPNCPLRTKDEIVTSYNNFVSAKSKFQISCFKFEWMNAWWAAKLSNNYSPEYLFPDALKKRSQDLADLYCPTGAIWIAETAELLKSGTFYGAGHTLFPINWKSAVDIDTYDDLDFAKVLFRMKHSSSVQ